MGMFDTFKTISRGTQVGDAVRGSLQDWSAAKSQWGYALRAMRSDSSVLTGVALRDALRQRVSPRRAGRQPRRQGELHLFVAYRHTDWEAVLPSALSCFGRVTSFEWRALGFDDSRPDWTARRGSMNDAMLRAFADANRDAPVDAFVGYLSGHNTAPETLQAIARSGAVVYNFCLDDKLGFPGPIVGGRHTSPAAFAHAVDLNLTNAPESLVKYAAHGGLAAFFPEAAYPEIHRPYETPFDIDVSFVGRCYGWRPRFIRSLEKLGNRVECFGPGWPNGPLDDQEMVRLYSRSRVNLGFSAVGYSRRLTCLKGRDFEVPMSGGLYLTQHNPDLRLVFDVGSEIVTYRGAGNCADEIRRLLADPVRAQTIRLAGRSRALRDHTYEARWRDVFELSGLLTVESKPSP